MNEEFLGWGGVRKLAKELGYSWFDVCDILWKTVFYQLNIDYFKYLYNNYYIIKYRFKYLS
jgi:hypothetical protein